MNRPRSISYPQALLVVLLLAVTVVILFATATSGAAYSTYNPNWDGTSDLRDQADAAGASVTVVEDPERYETLEAESTIVFVVAPDGPYAESDREALREFVERGGTVVVADEVDETVNPLLAGLGTSLQVDGDPLRDERHYRGSPALPAATPVTDHQLVEDVDMVTLNHGTALEANEGTVLVETSSFGYLDRNNNQQLDDDETLTSYPVAGIEPVGDGQVVAISDASALINVMIDPEYNQALVNELIEDHDRVIVDESHGDGTPPLVAAVSAVSEVPTLLVLASLGAVLVIAVWRAIVFRSVAQ